MRILIIILSLSAFGAKAQDAKYEGAMLRGKKLLNEAEGEEGFRSSANFFERIALKETGEWLPLYYQAQSLAFAGTTLADPDEKEAVLNKGLDVLSKAKKIEKNAELIALEGFVQMLRLTVDPATRGQSLSPTIIGLFQEALAMDPENPRALLFMGQMQYGAAQFFGKGFEEACKYIQSAYDIFEQQPEEETIYPDWGIGSATAALNACSQ